MEIAILEDDATLATGLGKFLSNSGHKIRIFSNGGDLLSALPDQSFDLFVLDWNVPVINGLDVLDRMRNQLNMTVPVMFLTSMSSEKNMAEALNMGADDYCVKPVQLHQFMARLHALENASLASEHQTISTDLIFGYHFNRSDCSVFFDNKTVVLSYQDYLLAEFLFRHIDRPVSKNKLLQRIWGSADQQSAKHLDQQIYRLKQLLNIGIDNQFLRLATIIGFGYRLSRTILDD